MHEIYGYGYVTKSTQNMLRSTVYKALRGRFILRDNIYIDVLQSDDKKKELKRLITHANKNDTIVIMNRQTLGNTKEFRLWWHELTYKHQINLLIVDDSAENGVDYYSTTDFFFERYCDAVIDEKWQVLQHDIFERVTKKVGRKSAEISDKFMETYWAYQSFYITVDEAYQNLAVSKQTFYSRCKEYELTDDYKKELLNHSYLFEYPIRGGISADMERMFQLVEHRKLTINEACIELEMPLLIQEEYHRLLLAKQGGRKIQFQMEKDKHIDNYFKK